MKKNFLPLFGAVAVPELVVLVSIAAAWWFPQSALAASPAECRQIMLLEALAVLGGALVGVYLEIAVLFFPPLVLLTLVYLAKVSSTGLSCAVIGFGWYLVLTFVEGIRAHRGEYGSARENPTHPHRRLDRRFVLLSALAPVVAVLIVARVPSRWAILGTIYFGLLVAVDTILRDAFDRIPRGILRSFRSHLDPETRKQFGVCLDCIHARPEVPATRKRPIYCGLSVSDPRFARHPAWPLNSCQGFDRIP